MNTTKKARCHNCGNIFLSFSYEQEPDGLVVCGPHGEYECKVCKWVNVLDGAMEVSRAHPPVSRVGCRV